jgi:hypothetical protein
VLPGIPHRLVPFFSSCFNQIHKALRGEGDETGSLKIPLDVLLGGSRAALTTAELQSACTPSQPTANQSVKRGERVVAEKKLPFSA